MSDTREPIDMQAALARIDRNLATSTKLHEELNKFTLEQYKLLREAEKFRAEEQKLWSHLAIGSVDPRPQPDRRPVGYLIVRHL